MMHLFPSRVIYIVANPSREFLFVQLLMKNVHNQSNILIPKQFLDGNYDNIYFHGLNLQLFLPVTTCLCTSPDHSVKFPSTSYSLSFLPSINALFYLFIAPCFSRRSPPGHQQDQKLHLRAGFGNTWTG